MRHQKSVNPYEEDPREVVAIIPPGCSLDQVGELMEKLEACLPGRVLHMANQTGGGFAVFYFTDGRHEMNEETGTFERRNVIAEESDPNIAIEVGDDDGPLIGYPATEPDELIAGIATNLRLVLDGYEAANYVTSTIIAPDNGEKYSITLQRVGDGYITPTEKISELEKRLAEAQRSESV